MRQVNLRSLLCSQKLSCKKSGCKKDGLRVFLILRQLESRQGFQPRGAASEGAEGAFVFDSASNERSAVHVLC